MADEVERRYPQDTIEVHLVHRPRYDGSLPKGKLEPGETYRHAALREVEEATGLRCEARGSMREVRYRDRKGRSKRVRYWAMEPLAGEFRSNGEAARVPQRCHRLRLRPEVTVAAVV